VQTASRKLDLMPLQVAQLERPQPVPERDQDHTRIAMPVAAGLAGCCHQPLDLGGREILAGAAN
jgi:hypothetical protein